MQMLPNLLNVQRREAAEPRCCKLEDRLLKAAKHLREKVALPVPTKLRHQGKRNWRNWSSEEKAAAVQLVKTAGYNHLALKHVGKPGGSLAERVFLSVRGGGGVRGLRGGSPLSQVRAQYKSTI